MLQRPDARPGASMRPAPPPEAAASPWRHRLHTIIFEADTPAGRAFDIALIAAIILSVILVIAESVTGTAWRFTRILVIAEWTLTVLFTIEYIVRLLAVRRPLA